VFKGETAVLSWRDYRARMEQGPESMENLIIPNKCGKCFSDFYIDYEVFRASYGRRVRLWCRGGHSIFVTLVSMDSDFNVKDLQDEKVLQREKILQREDAAIAKRTKSKTRSVLCDVCRQRIYHAESNQKRHPGACTAKATKAYYVKWEHKRKLQRIG